MTNSKQVRDGQSVARRIYHRIPTHHALAGTFDGEFERRIISAGGEWHGDVLTLRGTAVACRYRGFLWIKEVDPDEFLTILEDISGDGRVGPLPLWAGNVG
jgi:hypothetical protein